MPDYDPKRTRAVLLAIRDGARRATLGVMVRASLAAAAALSLWFAAPARAAEPVDLALVLMVDSSSSVNSHEFNLQMGGLADAFRDGAVLNAIKAGAPNGIKVTLVQWSSLDRQALAFGWTEVRDAPSAEAVARMIEFTPRLVDGGGTAISEAIDFSIRLLDDVTAARRVIDVSGDGRNNMGDYVIAATPRAVAAGITVNGLPILTDDPTLGSYYLSCVIGGVDAFVLVADDYEDFGRAIRLKLITEITGAPVALLPAPATLAHLDPPDSVKNRVQDGFRATSTGVRGTLETSDSLRYHNGRTASRMAAQGLQRKSGATLKMVRYASQSGLPPRSRSLPEIAIAGRHSKIVICTPAPPGDLFR